MYLVPSTTKSDLVHCPKTQGGFQNKTILSVNTARDISLNKCSKKNTWGEIHECDVRIEIRLTPVNYYCEWSIYYYSKLFISADRCAKLESRKQNSPTLPLVQSE
jgi:hypothetical protein